MTSKLNLKIIGCGGAGCNAISYMANFPLPNLGLVAVSNDPRHINTIAIPNRVLVRKEEMEAIATADQDLIKSITGQTKNVIFEFLKGTDMAFIICGLGGKIGTSSALAIAKLSKNMGIFSFASVLLPFKVEGSERLKNAITSLNTIKQVADVTMLLPNDKLLELAPYLPLSQAFQVMNEILYRPIKDIAIMVKPEEFYSLRSLLKSEKEIHLAIGKAKSRYRDIDVVADAFKSLFTRLDPDTIETAILFVTGGNDLNTVELKSIEQEIRKRISKNAKLMCFSNICLKPLEEIKLTVLLR